MVDLLNNPNRPLRDQLFEEYLVQTADWLLGPDNSPYLLAQAGNSNWECALSINYLLNIYEEINKDSWEFDELQENIEEYVPRTVSWMSNQVKKSTHHGEETVRWKEDDNDNAKFGEETAHWDDVTWDTAVCIRASLRTLDHFPDEFSEKEKNEIEDTVEKALRWLTHKFTDWEDSVMYSYGPADVAQILITACVVHKRSPDLLSSSIEEYYLESEQFIEDIVKYLITSDQDIDINRDTTGDKASYWGDPFQSAEVIDALTKYISEVEEGNIRESGLSKECLEKVYDCHMYIEYKQDEGKWGSHSDTCRTLYAYLRATTRVEDIEPEHHITFKAVRWVCDKKQTFDDGSYLHTMFLTVFYALALQEAYENWPLAERPTIDVLDKAMWSAPVRSSQERGQRLQLEIQYDDLKTKYTRIQNRFALSTAISGFLFVVILSIIFGGLFGWISLGSISIFNLLTYYGAIVLVLGLAIISSLYNYLSSNENKFTL